MKRHVNASAQLNVILLLHLFTIGRLYDLKNVRVTPGILIRETLFYLFYNSPLYYYKVGFLGSYVFFFNRHFSLFACIIVFRESQVRAPPCWSSPVSPFTGWLRYPSNSQRSSLSDREYNFSETEIPIVRIGVRRHVARQDAMLATTSAAPSCLER